MIFPLSRPAAAEGLVDVLADVDTVEYYTLDAQAFDGLISPLSAGSDFIQTTPSSGTYIGTRFRSAFPESAGIIGSTVFSPSDVGYNTTTIKLINALGTVMHNAEVYADQAVASIDTSGLEFWLERIDTNTQGLHGDLLNIQQALGWSGDYSPTVLDLLSSAHQALLGVMSRQDASQAWLDTLWGNQDLEYWYFHGGKINYRSSGTLKSYLSHFSRSQVSGLFLPYGSGSYLDSTGKLINISSSGIFLPDLVRRGFMGLSENLSGPDKLGTSSFWRGPDQMVTKSSDNLLDMLALLGVELQAPLAKLQYVWADDDDIRIAGKNQAVKDEIEENFVGDGGSAVKPSDIGDVASIGSSVKDTFSGAGSYSDIFSTLGDGSNFGFFSQEVADILEPSVPSPVSDGSSVDVDALMSDDPEFWGQFNIDENGFCTPRNSLFDVSSYLEGVS